MADLHKTGINTKYLAPIVVAYATAAGLLGLDRVTQAQSLLQHAGFAGLAGIVMIVLQELFPRSVKEVLVFWRLRDRLPGCRAFTVIAPKDARVDPTDLAVLLPSTPMSPAEQNALWYRLYRTVSDDPSVSHAHKEFLLTRDYAVPNYLGVGDVVFCASYSGNTEETLSAYDSAKKAGARIVARAPWPGDGP